jgi:hypothetical protein
MRRIWLTAALLLVATSHGRAGQLLFDNSSRADFTSSRGAESSPLAAITVSTSTSIDQIGAMVDLNSNGDLKFLIFNLDTHQLLFSTGSTAFVDNGLTFKVSSVFADFTLNPGITYGIGAIADVAGLWSINNNSAGNPFTENNITASDDRNGNVLNFNAPALGNEGTAMIMVQLYGGTQAVPEPTTIGSMAMGLLALAFVHRRSHRRDPA